MGNGVKVDSFILFVPFNFRLPVPRHEPKHVLNPSIVRDLNWYLHNYHNNNTNINTSNTKKYSTTSKHTNVRWNIPSSQPGPKPKPKHGLNCSIVRNKGMRLRPSPHPCTQHISFRQRGNKKKIRLFRKIGDLFFQGLSNTFLVTLRDVIEYRNHVLYVFAT